MAHAGRRHGGAWSRWAAALLLAALCAFARPAAAADSPAQLLKRAEDAFEYGDFARVVWALEQLPDMGVFALESDRIEAYKLLGLSYYFLNKPSVEEARREAREAFFGLLKQNPDYQLDPFYTPPDAVAFFDQVRREEDTYLAPIRRARAARVREEQAEADARKEAERRRKEQQQSQPAQPQKPLVLERVVSQNSALVAWMPFGLGQLQNGSPKLGFTLLGAQLAGAGASVFSFLMIEVLRDPTSGRFTENNYVQAQRLDVLKWVGAGLFYAAWAAGAVEANLHFVPTRIVSEETRLPAAAPEGPLRAPEQPPREQPRSAPPALAPPQIPQPPAAQPAPQPTSPQPSNPQQNQTPPTAPPSASAQPPVPRAKAGPAAASAP